MTADHNPYQPPAAVVADPQQDAGVDLVQLAKWERRMIWTALGSYASAIPLGIWLGLSGGDVAAKMGILAGAFLIVTGFNLYFAYQTVKTLGYRYPWLWPVGIVALGALGNVVHMQWLGLIAYIAVSGGAKASYRQAGYRITLAGKLVPLKTAPVKP